MLECVFNAQRCVRSCCEFRSVYTIEFWQCLRRMLCAYMTSDTHLWRLFVVISVVNSQFVSFRIPPKFIVDLPQSVFECAFNAQRCVRSCCEFRSVYTIEFWQCLRRMLCAYMYLGHASLTTIRRDFGHEFTARKFPKPPKFIVDLPQSVFECAFNAQSLQRSCAR